MSPDHEVIHPDMVRVYQDEAAALRETLKRALQDMQKLYDAYNEVLELAERRRIELDSMSG